MVTGHKGIGRRVSKVARAGAPKGRRFGKTVSAGAKKHGKR